MLLIVTVKFPEVWSILRILKFLEWFPWQHSSSNECQNYPTPVYSGHLHCIKIWWFWDKAYPKQFTKTKNWIFSHLFCFHGNGSHLEPFHASCNSAPGGPYYSRVPSTLVHWISRNHLDKICCKKNNNKKKKKRRITIRHPNSVEGAITRFVIASNNGWHPSPIARWAAAI